MCKRAWGDSLFFWYLVKSFLPYNNKAMVKIQILYASTGGHTEYVTEQLVGFLCKQGAVCSMRRVELAKPADLLKGDLLVLASGTWNTGGVEGQLNPHMQEFLFGDAKDSDLKGKKVALIALGDSRYFYTCRAGEHLRRFVQTHGGEVIEPALMLVNEPYGQEDKIHRWAEKLLDHVLRGPANIRKTAAISI